MEWRELVHRLVGQGHHAVAVLVTDDAVVAGHDDLGLADPR
jgi:hypothetical protein